MIDFLHVGPPKTASTWLQNRFFAAHPEVAVLGSCRTPSHLHRRLTEIVTGLTTGNLDQFDPAWLRCQLEELMSEHLAYLRERGVCPRILGISHEQLSGKFLSGRNRLRIAEILKEAFPMAKVVVFLRRQTSYIPSAYEQYIREGGGGSFSEFLLSPYLSGVSEGAGFLSSPYETDCIAYFRFSPLVLTYQRLFGRDRTYVGTMEGLFKDNGATLRALCQFLQVDPECIDKSELAKRSNEQLSNVSLQLLRRINHLFQSRYQYSRALIGVRFGAMLWRLSPRATREEAAMNPYLVCALANCGIRGRLVQILRAMDRCIFSPAWKKRHRHSMDSLDPRHANWLLEEYDKDNACLQELVDFDLSRLGYRFCNMKKSLKSDVRSVAEECSPVRLAS